MASPITSTPWFRQVQTLLTKNRRLLSRRPIHLFILLFSSVASVIFAWLAGRDARGPTGDFPVLTDCGMVDPTYVQEFEQADDYYSSAYNIPLSLNEPWRGGLPVWLMSLGPTAVGITVFLILRDELQSRRWGMLKAADMSAQWISWLLAFTVLGVINSLLGGITAVIVPDIHAFSSTYFGAIFGTLLFLNVALVAASFFLTAICGTCQSTVLSVFLIMGMIVAGSSPAIAAAASMSFDIGVYAATNTYSHPTGTGGAFWFYGSTERNQIEYDYDNRDPETNEFPSLSTECQNPIVSFDQSRFYKTPDEQDQVPEEEVFQGCYVVAGMSSAPTGASRFFWYFVPQFHFLSAWSNILGYTSLPGNKFSINEASKSPELLAGESLANHKGFPESVYDPNNTSGQLFPPGSTILTERYYDWTKDQYNYYYDDFIGDSGNAGSERLSTCPSAEVVPDLCSDYSECYNPKPGFPSTGSPSVNGNIGLLASLVAVYALLAAYVVLVLPMGNGAAMKCYFPFQYSYWCSSHRGENSEDEAQEGVQATGVCKSYGHVEALKPFSLTMKPGEVTAILGHNGAGKSTFVNVLCCEQNPTGGDITVNGRSVLSDQNLISKMIGECKQDDFLWPNLTAREHLELFAGIRGVRKEEMADTVQKWLESVDLDLVQHTRVSTFSGGMKRRLSVAISTIGNAPIVVLDEPTTGMDPVSRRYVWKHISEIKSDRVILLTTHAMEEADLLSDNVAIMANGSLHAYGSPLELKTKHGSALQFTLICDKENAAAVEEAVKHTYFADSLPFIEYSASESGYATLVIKKVSKDSPYDTLPEAPAAAVPVVEGNETDDAPEAHANPIKPKSTEELLGVPIWTLSDFIGWLEDDNSPVSEFGISNSSLEEVFLSVTRDAGPPRESHTNQSRSGCFSCCCCCRPPQHQTHLEEANTNMGSINALSLPFQNVTQSPKVNLSSYARKLSVVTQTKAIIRFNFARSWTGRPSIANWVCFSLFCVLNMLNGFGMVVFWPNWGVWYFLLPTVMACSFMLISIISPIYADRANGLWKMMTTQSMMESSFLLGTSIYSLLVQFAYTFVLLTLFYASPIFRTASTPDCRADTSDITDDIYDGSYSSYDYECGYSSFGEKAIVNPRSRNQVLSGLDADGNEVSVYAHSAPGGYGLVLAIIIVFSLTLPGAVLSSAFLPGFKLSLVGISLVVLAACASPGFLHLGYNLDENWLGNCTESFFQNHVNCSDTVFTLDNANADFVDCVGFSSMANIFSGSSSLSPFIMCTPSYVGLLPQMGLFQTLALSLTSDIAFYSEPKEYAQQFVSQLAGQGAKCSGTQCHFDFAYQLYGETIGYMLLGALLLLVLGIILATLMIYPSSCLVRARHLLSCRGRKQNEMIDSANAIEEMNEVDAERKAVHNIIHPFLTETEDVEAANDTAPVLSYSKRNQNQDQLPPVVMHKLRKVFSSFGGASPKVALRSLDLHVPKGEVLGLLGKNGAGKTTALKILAGMHDASSGIGLISGYDVETERNAVYGRLGNCPQFDICWKDQSVQRHLEFYARLKGIAEPEKAAFDIADAVGLGAPDVYNRPSGALSGGMRRRLSIAVSLIGSPDTLLLDEPTTGLDPSTRNEIWSLISSFATPERAIIITTHMMLEADALCNRIAIVAKGSLKVVGTQQHLKDNYGSGYLLQVNLSSDSEESINSLLQFVQKNIHNDAKIVTKQAKTIHMNLPRDVNMQKIFTTLYSDGAAEAMINQFLVSQSSLEDVFLALGE